MPTAAPQGINRMLLLQGIQLGCRVHSSTMEHTFAMLLNQSNRQKHTATEQLCCHAGRH